ncbi:MAG: methyltransferase [Sphingobacteriaceae bacterium]|nr:methyltransferase [Sphingobacteriaceae bacterium]
METFSNKDHWENVFATKAENEVSWFQPIPKTSIAFLEMCNLPLDANIIDVGAGDSHFVDVLLEKGYHNIYILDISANAIDRAKKRLGDKANQINWIVSDILDFKPNVKFDLWHDRASFHFLTSDEKINQYLTISQNAITSNGFLTIGTFSEKGPTKCSALQVKQYTETSMTELFKTNFDKIKCISEDHATPFNTVQNFLFCSFKRKA